MKSNRMIQILAELGNETRLSIFRLLSRAGNDGLTIGAIGKRLGVPASTLAFHLNGLVRVGLVVQRKQGRHVYCYAALEVLTQVLRALEAECCQEQGQKIAELEEV